MHHRALVATLLFITASLSAHLYSADIDVDKSVAVIAKKMAAFDTTHSDKTKFPNDAKGAEWTLVPSSDWVAGFYPGTLWYVYEFAKLRQWPDQNAWKQRADAWTTGMTPEQFNTTNHDLGFMMYDSFGQGYRLTGEPRYKEVLLQSAQSLSSRFRPEVKLIRSWGKITDMKTYTVIIDNMMNLELLMWAATNGGTTSTNGSATDLAHISTTHADRSMVEFFRPDNSTFHIVELDPKTGVVQRKRTGQGKADDSCWSRGQTWAMYGFTYMYEATKDQKYLDQAIKAADYYLAHLPADHVPPSDFNSTLTGLEFKDSSAAAIASCAFFRISRVSNDAAVKAKFKQAAIESLTAITSAPYFSDSADKASSLVYQARNYHPDANHRLTNISLIWGDYYLMEALLAYEASKH